MPGSLLQSLAAKRLQNNPQLAQLAQAQLQAAIPWAPFAGSPQARAYNSPADVIGYGGAAGGGKTDLLLGLAAKRHRRSLIFRRLIKSMDGMIDRAKEIYTPADVPQLARVNKYNESRGIWRLDGGGRRLRFVGLQYANDWEQYRGNAADLHAFDEATEFSELAIRSLAGWNRSSDPAQHCQVVLTFNPPIDEAGRWVIRFFLPWMAYLYPNLDECKRYTGQPAEPGELRYYTMQGDNEIEVPAGTPGAKSRTFYPASVEDNPIYMASGYAATLEALPEPLRSQLRHGSFEAGIEADPWQVIPGPWVRAAMARHDERTRPEGRPLAAALDVARGGRDSTALAQLWAPDYVDLQLWPGRQTPDGPSAAGLALQAGLDAIMGIAVDVIGVGASAYDFLVANGAPARAVNFAEAAPAWARDRSNQLKFSNTRAAQYWALREGLDPAYGASLALPNDEQLYLDLTSPRWHMTSRGIQIEAKEQIIDRIGRSPDRGDAVVMLYWLANTGGSAGL